ncbi:MAG: two-component system, OmpR family, sensor kinase [Solirubrobacteraceae bacterium]|nr:two-component system, OmpR family, sensor kinase [Solirubrobacteraceae bacterium]
MRPRTLTGRLTAAAALAVVVAVACLAVSAQLLVAHQLRSSLDTSLRRRAVDIARLSVSAPALLTAPGALEAPAGGRQLAVEVLDRHGRFVARSLTLGAKLLPATDVGTRALRPGRSGFADIRLGDRPMRLFAAPLPDDGGPAAGGAVLVASSTEDIEHTLHRLGWLLLLSGALAAAVGAASAALLTRRGLRPLGRLSAGAAEIERTGDAARRLPDPRGEDEVAELARTLNGMLAALDVARERERRFVADASHELRTPLTSLAGNVDFIARHGLNPEVLSDLQLDTERLQRLVGDLLALEREAAGPAPQEPVRLDRIVADAVAERPSVRVGRCDPATVVGEADALRRALGNLLENGAVHGHGEVTVSLELAGGTAVLAVADEGPGLTPDEVEHAFERFWRSPDALGRPGSGLGLAIVRATTERHGGSVTVDGATIRLMLPATATAAAAPADVPGAAT